MAVGALLFAAFAGLARGLGSTDTITWGGDNSRAGYETYVWLISRFNPNSTFLANETTIG